jgi:hypothetical protein
MSKPCGCCAGCGCAAPERLGNRPGLARLDTRIGDHRSFFEAMVARLSAGDFARLAKLRSRSLDDASIALLDAWALVADVLTFYQERIANECYLRTATERRSLVELARLVGYRARPGASAATYLAFTLENEAIPGEIPAGTRVNSVPGPGETMVAFETSETILARREWNALKPLLSRPQTSEAALTGLWLKGTDTRLNPGDCLIIEIDNGARNIRFVRSLEVDHENGRTLVRFAKPDPPKPSKPGGLEQLEQPETVPPRSGAALPRSLETSFAPNSAAWAKLLGAAEPILGRNLHQALRNTPPAKPLPLKVYAMRVAARPWGYNASLRLTFDGNRQASFQEWHIDDPQNSGSEHPDPDLPQHRANLIYLDNEYAMAEDSLVVIDQGHDPMVIIQGARIRHVALNAYGLSGKSVQIDWKKELLDWLQGSNFTTVRTTRVFAGSELLELAEAPIVEDVEGDEIELDGLYDGLDPGRWVIVEGERTDIVDQRGATVPGVRAAELVMLASVRHDVRRIANGSEMPGETRHTHISLAGNVPAIEPRHDDDSQVIVTTTGAAPRQEQPARRSGLAYRYKRGTVIIHANVAPATHGETRSEVLGSGDASVPIQSFALKQPPLTYVSAATPSGIASTLQVRVNDLLWHESASLAGLGPTDRKYVTRDDNEGVTSVIFGNGVRGARLPTGRENVRALYRTGIGRMGNVAAGRLSLLATRPLGVKGVVNPLPATGGADRDSAASIRRNAPIAVIALDRLVATPDYENFSRNFGGVGKARASRETEGVRVIVAGVDDIPIARDSELIRNLETALRSFGDRQVAVRVEPRKRLFLVMQAAVRIDPDYEWAVVEPKIRAALLEAFSFERTELGDYLPLGRALAAIQAVPGVVYSDIDVFDRLSEAEIVEGFIDSPGLKLGRRDLVEVAVDEIAYLAPDMADTLILQEVPK